MNIDNSLIREYLKDVYFVTGTACAGKSTVCTELAKKYNLEHCEENYNLGNFINMSNIDQHPNLNYFNTMENWEAFVSRSKEEYEAWFDGVQEEIYPFEILELIKRSKNKKVIVDTNIPLHILHKIALPEQVVVMVASQEIALKSFFDRPDLEKQFLYQVIQQSKQPEALLQNFKECIAHINRQERIDRYIKSGFHVIRRFMMDEPIDDKIKQVEEYFELNKK